MLPVGDEQARRFFEESGFAVGRAKGLRCGDPVLIAHTLDSPLRKSPLSWRGLARC